MPIVPIDEQKNVILSTKIPKAVMDAIISFSSESGTTPYELCQIFAYKVAEFARYKQGLLPSISEQTLELMDTFAIEHNIHDTVMSYKRATGSSRMQPSDGDIRYLITVHKGGVVTVYDPLDTEHSFSGSVTISLDKALEILLSKDDKLPEMFMNVMADRQLTSISKTITDVFKDENATLGRLDDEMLGYKMNEYGNVPRKTHVIKPNE